MNRNGRGRPYNACNPDLRASLRSARNQLRSIVSCKKINRQSDRSTIVASRVACTSVVRFVPDEVPGWAVLNGERQGVSGSVRRGAHHQQTTTNSQCGFKVRGLSHDFIIVAVVWFDQSATASCDGSLTVSAARTGTVLQLRCSLTVVSHLPLQLPAVGCGGRRLRNLTYFPPLIVGGLFFKNHRSFKKACRIVN